MLDYGDTNRFDNLDDSGLNILRDAEPIVDVAPIDSDDAAAQDPFDLGIPDMALLDAADTDNDSDVIPDTMDAETWVDATVPPDAHVADSQPISDIGERIMVIDQSVDADLGQDAADANRTIREAPPNRNDN